MDHFFDLNKPPYKRTGEKLDGRQFFGFFKGKTLGKPGKIPGKNWTGDKKKVVVDGRDPNIARPFIRGGCKNIVQVHFSGLADDEYDVRVGESQTPVTYAWACASKMVAQPTFSKKCVTKQEWLEAGHRATEQKFNQI